MGVDLTPSLEKNNSLLMIYQNQSPKFQYHILYRELSAAAREREQDAVFRLKLKTIFDVEAPVCLFPADL